jgi:hypothetical protein
VEIEMKLEKKMAACAGAVLAIAMTASASAQTVSCRGAADGMLKHATTPYHMYMTEASGAKGEQEKLSETISAGGAFYVNVNGKWIKSGMTVQDMAAMQRGAADSVSRLYTCTRIGSDKVNGVTAQHYHVEGKTEDGVKQEDMWLSSDGFIQQIVIYGDDDSGARKAYRTMRYVYTNVQAPPGVK